MQRTIVAAFLATLLPCGFLAARESNPRPAVLEYQKAQKLFAASRYPEALAAYHRALELPQDGIAAGDIRARIGDAHFRMGAFHEALPWYRKAMQDPSLTDRQQVQYWIGFCSFLLGRDADAVAELLKVPQFTSGSGMWSATAYYWAGRASERMGKKKDAAEYYRKASGGSRSTQGNYAQKRAETLK